MPLKSILKFLWLGNLLLFFAIVIMFGITFKNRNVLPTSKFVPSMDKNAIEQLLAPRAKEINTNQLTKEEYAIIYNAKVLLDPPIQTTYVPPKIQQDWHKELLQQKVKIVQIPRVGFALVSIKGQEAVLIESLNENNKKNNNKPWQIQLDGNNITAMEITPGKGIKFRFDNGGREVFIEYKETNLPIKSSSSASESFEIREISSNNWEVSSQKGTEILQNLDKKIEEIAPMLEYDDEGQAVGVRLRGIKNSSEAYKFGLRQDDLVKNINGIATNNLDPSYIKQMIRQNRNTTKLQVEIIRNGQPVKLTFNVVR